MELFENCEPKRLLAQALYPVSTVRIAALLVALGG